jgi:hypothetical protein
VRGAFAQLAGGRETHGLPFHGRDGTTGEAACNGGGRRGWPNLARLL